MSTAEIQKDADASIDSIIQVTDAAGGDDDDDIMRRLKTIPKFEPLFKDSTFGLEGLLGPRTRQDNAVRPGPPTDVLWSIQQHVKKYKSKIHDDQRSLLERIQQVDELSQQVMQRMLLASNQAQLVSVKDKQIQKLDAQVKQLQSMVADIFTSLHRMRGRFEPQDRIGDSGWPELDMLYQKTTSSADVSASQS